MTFFNSIAVAVVALSFQHGSSFAFSPPSRYPLTRSIMDNTWRDDEGNHALYSSQPNALTQSIMEKNTCLLARRRRFDEEFEEQRIPPKEGGGLAETVAGGVLGGMLGGPFGALFGAQIGAQFGRSNAQEKARKEEMQRLGISQSMLDTAQEVGMDLNRAIEGLKATRSSLETHQSFAKRLNENVDELYEKAMTVLKEGDEDEARQILLERTQVEQKLKKVLLQCADERKRLKTMERNVEILEERAMEVDGLLRRSVGAKAMQDTSSFALSEEDPLLKKFRDAGID